MSGGGEKRLTAEEQEVSSSDSDELRLALAILRYLDTYPEAKDTLDGIVQYWLRAVPGEFTLAHVERALSLLLSKNLILKGLRTGMPAYYHLNHDRRADLSRIFKDLPGAPGHQGDRWLKRSQTKERA